MKKKDDKQTSFNFDRPPSLTQQTPASNARPLERGLRIVRSNHSPDSPQSVTNKDVFSINKRILDLIK
jgi:hypothetical protein